MSAFSSLKIIDLTHRLDENTPPFPGDPPVAWETAGGPPLTREGDSPRLQTSSVRMCLHCGTHMDAPIHFFPNAASIDRISLEAVAGPATLLRIEARADREIQAEQLEPYEALLRGAGRAVLNTGWHRRWGEGDYFTDHPVMARGAARFLVGCGVRLVGIDTPSVDRPPHEAHLELLGKGVLILENLANLDAIGSERFLLIALPLKLAGRDGSPVRAVAVLEGEAASEPGTGQRQESDRPSAGG